MGSNYLLILRMTQVKLISKSAMIDEHKFVLKFIQIVVYLLYK